MHVAALLVAGTATIDDSAIDATRIPTTSYWVTHVPVWLTVPLVLVVHAPAGDDYNAEIFVVCKDPDGTVRGALRSAWQWPDEDGRPSKYRCFNPQLSFAVETVGEYTIGVYLDAEGTLPVATPIPLLISFGGDRFQTR
ncbi:hypothetical protein [Mycobacterium sp. 1423905.2]|jgi:hypothetical protein|uniref:hypothetical protein n=1 Tax=Mycobacterium sp. 1423905.2 TaxID=1856859 RepID=UPI0007FBFE18|nr:hypothetical protein [Mycobacterium sp. 1423905.2]OBJ62797.1 hypothetical protein A9W95_07960 [Mycobacterium sp. 1423905.2]